MAQLADCALAFGSVKRHIIWMGEKGGRMGTSKRGGKNNRGASVGRDSPHSENSDLVLISEHHFI